MFDIPVKNKLDVYFLGQAGFLLVGRSGRRIAVDPYLSDCCNRYFGFKRLMPEMYTPWDMDLDLLLATHSHYDHFDVDSVPIMMQNRETRLIASVDCQAECERLGLDIGSAEEKITLLRVGDETEQYGISIQAVQCDHGELAPEAAGFLINMEGLKIYIAGDTAYRPDIFSNQELHHPDLFIMPINGAFGNMNEEQAAQAIKIIKPKMAVPCHFWNFAEHGGNPLLFMENMKECAAGFSYTIMRMGECIPL